MAKTSRPVMDRALRTPASGTWQGCWPKRRLSSVIFEDEQSARAMAEKVQVPEGVRLLHTEVREVVASA